MNTDKAECDVFCTPRSGEGVGSPVTGVTEVCEPPCKYWEFNQGPLENRKFYHLVFLASRGDSFWKQSLGV